MKTTTIVSLTIQELFKVISDGTLTGREIVDATWKYRDICIDAGRGNPTYEREVVGDDLEVKA